jgi:ribonuclease HI
MSSIRIWTDGACQGNPGPGGWGFVLSKAGEKGNWEARGFIKDTTNNRAELTAVYFAFLHLNIMTGRGFHHVRVYTDSRYVVNCLNLHGWVEGWKLNGWKTSTGSPVKNVDLLKKISMVMSGHKFSFVWVKGHDKNKNNIKADKLATSAINMGDIKLLGSDDKTEPTNLHPPGQEFYLVHQESGSVWIEHSIVDVEEIMYNGDGMTEIVDKETYKRFLKEYN